MAAAEPIVRLHALAKSYAGRQALREFELTVRRGEIFGLIGPDGAGKTTALRIICGILRADAGEAQVLGTDVLRDPETVKRRIGYLSQRFSLYADLTVAENLAFFSDLYQVPRGQRERRQAELLAFSRLGPFQDRLAGDLSGGMKQKLGVSCALIHTPELLVLDEPTTGVDPVSRRELWALLYRLWQDGLTILLTTPYLDEAERCTRVGLVDGGRMFVVGAPAALKAAFPETVYEIHGLERRAAEQAAHRFAGLTRAEVFGDRLHAVGNAGLEAQLAAHFAPAGERVTVRTVPPTMEDLYFHQLAQPQRHG